MSKTKYDFKSPAEARQAIGYPTSSKKVKAAKKFLKRFRPLLKQEGLTEGEKRDQRWAVVIEAKAELGKYSRMLREAEGPDEAREALQALCHLTTLSLTRHNPHLRCYHFIKRLKKYS